MQFNPGRRTWRSQAVVIISSVIVAATGALVITSCSTTQHPATLPQVSCGTAWTHFVNSDTQFLGADHGALTCFNTAALSSGKPHAMAWLAWLIIQAANLLTSPILQ